jgi:hypothetical protein
MDEYFTLLFSENTFDVATRDVDESPLVDEDSFWGGPITWCVIV